MRQIGQETPTSVLGAGELSAEGVERLGERVELGPGVTDWDTGLIAACGDLCGGALQSSQRFLEPSAQEPADRQRQGRGGDDGDTQGDDARRLECTFDVLEFGRVGRVVCLEHVLMEQGRPHNSGDNSGGNNRSEQDQRLRQDEPGSDPQLP
ncbi:hypothetical protein BJ988_001715 [Nocardioides panzhihuensis]|uniref:Uncharacterized protein n=1 Tax=Nocardioides panzhihuensis TaxID=860243 RepID=A0A7Z0DKK9_9ACTN|nr:hypothetical protein [Nocardioides panzhihuensis]